MTLKDRKLLSRCIARRANAYARLDRPQMAGAVYKLAFEIGMALRDSRKEFAYDDFIEDCFE